MTEFAKTLLSAATGALFGIVGNVAMEFAKPYIARHVSKKTVSAQLAAELLGNMDTIEAAVKIITNASDQPNERQHKFAVMAVLLLKGVKTDRFDDYFENQKATVYEIDTGRKLISMYPMATNHLPAMLDSMDFQQLRETVELVARTAREYILEHNLTYSVPGKGSLVDLFSGF